jgi:hypothetical protein
MNTVFTFIFELNPADPDYGELMEPKAIMKGSESARNLLHRHRQNERLGLYHFKSVQPACGQTGRRGQNFLTETGIMVRKTGLPPFRRLSNNRSIVQES